MKCDDGRGLSCLERRIFIILGVSGWETSSPHIAWEGYKAANIP